MEKKEILHDKYERMELLKRNGGVAEEIDALIYSWAIMNHTHILRKRRPVGVSEFLMCVLTAYAIRYSIRHGRYGHLFRTISNPSYVMKMRILGSLKDTYI